jgi:PPM family protein phosphatase
MTLLRSGSATDTGLVRAVNQDLAVEFPNLYAVADGMGGHAGGEVAARLAVDTLVASFGRQPTGSGLSEAVTAANSVVWEHSLDHPELRGMGTTLAAVALVNEDDRDLLALVNVGDSRVYRFHDGKLSQITTDHSLAEEMVKSGELTSDEAAVHPHRHILTRALGAAADVTVDLWRIQPARGDRFLLCSDGLTNELEEPEIAQVLSSVSDPQEASDLLVRAARSHGGSDNITAVVVDVVVGEADDGAVPAVAAVASDFRTVPAGSNGAAAAVDDAAKLTAEPVPEEASRRARRKAKRRARRIARGRRLVTLRTLIVLLLLAALVVGALAAVRWYNNNSYFVAVDNNELVIYQGRIGGFLWYHPAAVEHTLVTTADVPSVYLGSLNGGVEESSLQAARTYVTNLVATRQQQLNPGGPSPATTTSTTRPPTQKAP